MKRFLLLSRQTSPNPNAMKVFASLLCSLILASCVAQEKDAFVGAIPFKPVWDIKPLKYEAGKNNITITAGKESDLYCFVDGNYYANTAPKFLFTPDSNFVLTTRIVPDFKSVYDGGAILIYSDNSNWAKLLFEMNEDKSVALGSSLVRNRSSDDNYHTAIDGKEVFVRLARSGKVFNFYYSKDGKKWNLLRTFPYEKFENMKIGFYAQSPKGESCAVQFKDITYKGEKYKDYFTGN
jgi:regulation of enolase protein 1 (concanavalin A-like superfamily)